MIGMGRMPHVSRIKGEEMVCLKTVTAFLRSIGGLLLTVVEVKVAPQSTSDFYQLDVAKDDLAKEVVRTIVGGPVRAWGHLKSEQKFGVTWKLSGSPASLGGQAEVRHHLEAGRKFGVTWRPGGDPALLGGRGEVRRHLEAGRNSGVAWRPGGDPTLLGGRAELRRHLEAGRRAGLTWRPWGSPASLGGRAEIRRYLEAGGKSGVTWRPGGTLASLGGRREVRHHLEAGRRSGVTWRPGGSPASLEGRAELRRCLTIRRWSRRSFFPPFLLLFPSPSSSLRPLFKENEGSIYRFLRVAWLVNKGEIRVNKRGITLVLSISFAKDLSMSIRIKKFTFTFIAITMEAKRATAATQIIFLHASKRQCEQYGKGKDKVEPK
ncbi:hypothetical protein M5K25_020224 [Dendrobium thyrsiflorum]|uniref:Uncharacterized protein n=1 Tax=Dendrobium thyrsiflorum TaxID=117978 RepID=A0ABD0UA04_DENTH